MSNKSIRLAKGYNVILFFISILFILFSIQIVSGSEPVKIRIGYGTPPADITPLLFQKPEILKYYGKSYTTDFIHFRGTAPQLQAIVAKEVDVGTLSFISFANLVIKANVDLKIVSDLQQDGYKDYYSTVFAVRENSGINRIEDLRGKIVATNVIGGGLDLAARIMLKRKGLIPDKDVKLVEVQFPNMEATLREGKIDAGSFLEQFWAKAKAKPGLKILFYTKDAVGTNQMIMKVARADFLKSNQKVAKEFFEDWVRGWKFMLNPANRSEAVKITSKFTKLPESLLDSFMFTKNDFYRDPDAIPNAEAIQNNFDLLYKEGFIDKKLEAGKYIDTSWVKPR